MTYLENIQQTSTKHPVESPGILFKGSGITFFYYVLVKLLYFKKQTNKQTMEPGVDI